jgi:tRNA(Met) cytidine acetyltransferase
LHISGEVAWCVQQACRLVEQLAESSTLWIGDEAPETIASSNNQQALIHLGGEQALLIYNAFSGFDPDAFGAISGTLRGGGLLLLLTPPLDRWAEYRDPQSERIAVANCELPIVSPFFKRLAGILQSDPQVVRLTPEQTGSCVPPAAKCVKIRLPQDQTCRTQDQADAVEGIIHVAKGHRKRPLVLTSDRGRGKSSSLGIAAARLVSDRPRRILVTASRQSAVQTLFEMAAKQLNSIQTGVDTLYHDDGLIQYIAPDLLIAERPVADLVLVDEAATIPTPLLISLLHHYPRIVFATTVHGYEGTGLGFNHRFKKHLDNATPQWREIHLKTPIRWAPFDPLEQLVFRLLALDAEPVQSCEIDHPHADQLTLRFPNQKELGEDENLLQQLFGLLVLAHYRTTPRDLWHLLDGPNLTTVTLSHKQQVVAVALLASEGEFSPDLAMQIWLGRRRPRGHLLAQSLSAHLGIRSASTLKGMRIMRIAVHPAHQNRGFGRHLVTAIKRYVTEQNFDYLGVSFGATGQLIRFWQNNGMQAVRLGVHAGASSSHQSVMFLYALNDAGEALHRQARARYAQQLPALLADSLSHLEADLVGPLIKGIEAPALADLTDQDWLDLATYAFANRGYEYTQSLIQRLALKALSDALLDDSDSSLLIMRVLQKQDWKRCAAIQKMAGHKAVDQRLRDIIKTTLVQYASDELIRQARSFNSPQ